MLMSLEDVTAFAGRNYVRYEYLLAQVQLVFFMLGMGATLTGGDFVGVVRRPRSLLVGVAGQFLLSPLWAVLVSRWAGVGPGVAVGLILIAAMPGGPLSKLFTFLGRGNIALSITLSVIGTLGSVVTVPALLGFLAPQYVPDDFAMPVGAIVRDVALYLLMPLGVGMAVARRAPLRRRAFTKWCVRTGFVFVVLMVAGSFASGRVNPGQYGWPAPLAIIAFCVLAQQTSMLPFRALGWSKPDCLSVGIEVTMRNLNLALLLKALLFPARLGANEVGDGVLFVILFYAGTALGAGVPLALHFRLLARKVGAAPAAQTENRR
jgi:BASS family bile acid:Na+ symporter